MFDSLEQIIKLKEKILDAINVLQLDTCLQESDFSYIAEYVKCLAPVAKAIDILQSETNCFHGTLLPTIICIKRQLNTIASEELEYCRPIVAAINESLDSRFSCYLNIEQEGCNAAIASMTHPQFKGRWLTCLSPELQEKVKSVLMDAGKKESQTSTPSTVDTASEDCSLNTNFFDFGDDQSTQVTTAPFRNISSDIEILAYLEQPCSTDFISLNQFPLVKKLFVRYNVPLPSFAPVERLFSYATMYDLPRFNRLKDELFEKRILLKANRCKI